MSKSVSERRKKLAKENGGMRCFRCQRGDSITLDHIIPRNILARRNLIVFEKLANVQLLCKPCHRKKSGVEQDLRSKGKEWREIAEEMLTYWDFRDRVRMKVLTLEV